MDNDGWLDIFVANGHVYPQFDAIPNAAHFRQPMLLFRNRRNGSFEEVSKAAELADIPLESRRGVAFGDINNDGCVDIVALNVGAPPSLLLNHCQNGNHRVLFQLLGSKSNRLAIGARVSVRTGKLMQMSEVKAARVISPRAIFASISAWRPTTRSTSLRFAGRTERLTPCTTSPRTISTSWWKDAGSRTRWRSPHLTSSRRNFSRILVNPIRSVTGAPMPHGIRFEARELHPVQGRWISPDPAGLQAVDPARPQTWNRYPPCRKSASDDN